MAYPQGAMVMETKGLNTSQLDVAYRIREMREISGYTYAQMAEKTEVSIEMYKDYEAGKLDFPFSFIHKCSRAFGIGITDLLEGHSANLSSYNLVRRGTGPVVARENGIQISSMAPMFQDKLAQPYWVRYEYDEKQQNHPIQLSTHAGQEFDIVISGQMKIQVGQNFEVLEEGDSIFYNSSTPHGMIASGGKDCLFCAMIMPREEPKVQEASPVSESVQRESLDNVVSSKFVKTYENSKGLLVDIKYSNEDKFNFAFDVVDEIAKKDKNKLALLHVALDKTETRFTFNDISKASNRCANYFKSLGIEKGDRVMLVLKRHYQFWFAMMGLHKLGAIAIPATYQLQSHDYTYRFQSAGVKAIVCTSDGDCAHQVELGSESCPTLEHRIIVGEPRPGWRNFDEEYTMFSSHFARTKSSTCGNDPMVMFFTSGTTGYPKIAVHSCKYALGHFATAKYLQCVHPEGLHLTVSDTGWGKALWGKLYGQWLCEAPVAVFEFERFSAKDFIPMLGKYNVTTFCAPPTIYRMMIREDLTQFDFSTIRNFTTAGEALNPEVFKIFKKATGLEIHEGFGQTETTLVLANIPGMACKPGSMGKPMPPYKVELLTDEGTKAEIGATGEMCISLDEGIPCGLFLRYYSDVDGNTGIHDDGYFHTGDLAWKDEDGYFWYVGRKDDVIKSSGYRIGPFEIENVIMELPYVLECGVSAAADEVRGQVVKASIVLTPGTQGTDELAKEIQDYVKKHTAPYKYPRIVEFKTELPKTISGKIIRRQL